MKYKESRFKNPFKRQAGLDFNRKRKIRSQIDSKPLIKLLACIGGGLALGFVLAFLFFTGAGVTGTSMSPTLYDGNRVFINRIGVAASLKVGDIVAFNRDNTRSKSISIKRVVALPGDTVVIDGGILYVNGVKEKTDMELDLMNDPGMARHEIELLEGEYFLLGDNRNNSEDSRFESVGNVRISDIIGVVWLCYSLDNFGLVG